MLVLNKATELVRLEQALPFLSIIPPRIDSFQLIIEQNEIANNDVGLSIDYCTSSYVRNNMFLGNNKTALFRWFWFFSPIANIRDKIPRFDKNLGSK
jgi:hypothetical protein